MVVEGETTRAIWLRASLHFQNRYVNNIRCKHEAVLNNSKNKLNGDSSRKQRKKKLLESYTSFGPQSPSTKRQRSQHTINAETLIPTSRFMLKNRRQNMAQTTRKFQLWKQVESNKRNALGIVESKQPRMFRREYKSDVGPGRYEQIFHLWENNLTVEEAIGALSEDPDKVTVGKHVWRISECFQLMTSTIYCDTRYPVRCILPSCTNDMLLCYLLFAFYK